MKNGMKNRIVFSGLALGGALAMLVAGSPLAADKASDANEAAVDRTRQQIMMLDDLYKTAVVLITEHYVKDPTYLSAATAAKALFAEMKKKGRHEVRLIGFTDVLFNQENKPSDAFEKTAAKKLLAGKPGHEEVLEKGGKRYLRVATPLPVVMEKCIMCHVNWKGNKGNIGALSYTVPMVE